MSADKYPENPFYGQDFISIDQIQDLEQIKFIFDITDQMKGRVEAREAVELLKLYSVAILFYQPSTRTFSSFVSAANRLGSDVFANQNMEKFSSAIKGESLPDTIRSIHQTTAADAIVLRHPDNKSSVTAAKYSEVPIINAGSGVLEHPTQSLLDLYTIYSFKETFDNLKIALVGDLLYGRTTKSLAKLLALVGESNEIALVSPDDLRTPPDLVGELEERVQVTELDDLNEVLEWADVIYMTRVQKEWFEKEGRLDDYERLKEQMTLTSEMVDMMRDDALIMHPLPRQGELRYGVDEKIQAKYFDQMRFGLYVRMALLTSILRQDAGELF